MGLTEEQKQIGKVAFGIFGGAKGKLTRTELADALRAMGKAPHLKDLPSGDSFTEDALLSLGEKLEDPGDKANGELQEALRAFDKTATGTIVAKEFAHMSTVLGEPFSKDEVDAFMQFARDGKIDCGDVHKKMTAEKKDE
eukprot:m.333022 g.333022  ORF g.333022 m.333022 type:complete len:140 (+) comp17046_c0_seq1:97-516(+)